MQAWVVKKSGDEVKIHTAKLRLREIGMMEMQSSYNRVVITLYTRGPTFRGRSMDHHG